MFKKEEGDLQLSVVQHTDTQKCRLQYVHIMSHMTRNGREKKVQSLFQKKQRTELKTEVVMLQPSGQTFSSVIILKNYAAEKGTLGRHI